MKRFISSIAIVVGSALMLTACTSNPTISIKRSEGAPISKLDVYGVDCGTGGFVLTGIATSPVVMASQKVSGRYKGTGESTHAKAGENFRLIMPALDAEDTVSNYNVLNGGAVLAQVRVDRTNCPFGGDEG